MSISDHYRGGQTERMVVTIVTSDAATSQIEVVGRDAAVIRIAPPNGPLVRWPKEGELWIIKRENGLWQLESFVENADSVKKTSTLMPGEASLNASRLYAVRVRVGDYPEAEADLDVDLTTPQSNQIFSAREDDLDRLVSPNPGRYNWGIFAIEINMGNAPITAVAGRARGHTVYTVSSSGRAYGFDAAIHGFEITSGFHPSEATVQTQVDSRVLTDILVTQKGSRFEAGMPISGTGIPGGALIESVTGRPGAPTSITMSVAATATAVVPIKAQAFGALDGIGALITGNCGTSDPNKLGAALQVQGQNEASRWQYGINIGASGLQATGTAFRLASATANRGLSIESSNLADAIIVSGGTITNAAIRINVDAPIKIGQAIGAGKGYLEMWEQSADPAAPSANAGRLFLKDNGAGKTQLGVRTITGSHIVWTEP
jgi:hypothetical protein